jgi:hypothetical protein
MIPIFINTIPINMKYRNHLKWRKFGVFLVKDIGIKENKLPGYKEGTAFHKIAVPFLNCLGSISGILNQCGVGG